MAKLPTAYWWLRKHWWKHCREGIKVHVIDDMSSYISPETQIGNNTTIEPNVWITGKTVIGKNCRIGFGSVIADSAIGNNTIIEGAVLKKAVIGNNVQIAEAKIEQSSVGDEAEIGFGAQLKRTQFGERSKMMHHGYLGDCVVGRGVNIAAGVITANYDGVNKQKTVIEDGAFIGTNVNLVAPVTIPKGAMIAAGSTVTGKDGLAPGDLAIARAPIHISRTKKVVVDEDGWHVKERQEEEREKN